MLRCCGWTVVKVGEATELCYSPKWCGYSVRLSLVHVIGVIVHSFEAKLCRARALKVDPWTTVKVGEATKPCQSNTPPSDATTHFV